MSTKPTEIVFFLTVLRSEDLRVQYETWVRDVDTPLALALDGVESYRVVRLSEAAVMDGVAVPSLSYLEIIEVSDLAAYQKAIAAAPASFFEQFDSFIKTYQAVSGVVIN
ncbi:hypothetical protein [Gordonia sp. C13]|uniref:hypothetical protein n=1 Tax=Gordonia sp. C13 TaxID=2935078 RepID=UPI00200AC67D|nr:hypothetical protein [Gordonia sp. C13]MCK8615316.1 hypothetical protein [Gordonia sp. C13]